MKEKLLIIFIIFLSLGQGKSQQLPDCIKISCGYLKSPDLKYHDFKWNLVCVYVLKDSTLYLKKKENEKFKKINFNIPNVFYDSITYYKLDSIMLNKVNWKHYANPYNTCFYKIELIFNQDNISFKTRGIEFIGGFKILYKEPVNIIQQILNAFWYVMN